MRRPWWAAIGVTVAFAVAGCSSGSSTSPTDTTATTAPVSPSTVLDPSPGVTVPFTADGGALVVTDGPPPADVSHDRAVTRFFQLRDASNQPAVVTVVSGLVTVRAGLGPDPVVERPAWVIVYSQVDAYACPAEGLAGPNMTARLVPENASHLRAIVIMGEHPLADDSGHTIAPIFGYDGAGTGGCGPSVAPTILTEDQLNHGEG